MLIENIKLFFQQLDSKTEHSIAEILINKAITISVAESCTGGLISSRLLDIPNSSNYIKENYVTYSNEAKKKLLNVTEQTLERYSAVSEECALEMAEGLFKRTGSDISLATTGLAGPGGATANKNIGLLYVAIKNKSMTKVKKFELNPHYKRKTMKFLFSQKALEFLIEFLKETSTEKNQ